MGVRLAAEDGFQPPSTADFELPPVFGDNPYTTKPVFLVFFSVILISVSCDSVVVCSDVRTGSEVPS